jgi:hypothetical protein
VNQEEQYSIWPHYKPIPDGWCAVGKRGSKADCMGIHRRALDRHASKVAVASPCGPIRSRRDRLITSNPRANLFLLPYASGTGTSFRSLVAGLPRWVRSIPVALPGRGVRYRDAVVTDWPGSWISWPRNWLKMRANPMRCSPDDGDSDADIKPLRRQRVPNKAKSMIFRFLTVNYREAPRKSQTSNFSQCRYFFRDHRQIRQTT